MSDSQYAAYEAKVQTSALLEAEILPRNKQIVFDALAASGIAVVTVNFDGSGDSGQFDEATALTAENTEVPIPQDDIEIEAVDFDAGIITRRVTTIREFVETLGYDFLEGTHSGWENDDGAYGQFRFTLADRTITLEYNERYIECHYHEHQF